MCKNKIEDDNTYLFKNFRYRWDWFGTYVNLPKNESCSIEKWEDVMDMRDVDLFESSSFIVEEELTLISIASVSKHVLCNKCNKKLNIEEENFERFVKAITVAIILEWNIPSERILQNIIFKKESQQERKPHHIS